MSRPGLDIIALPTDTYHNNVILCRSRVCFALKGDIAGKLMHFQPYHTNSNALLKTLPLSNIDRSATLILDFYELSGKMTDGTGHR